MYGLSRFYTYANMMSEIVSVWITFDLWRLFAAYNTTRHLQLPSIQTIQDRNIPIEQPQLDMLPVYKLRCLNETNENSLAYLVNAKFLYENEPLSFKKNNRNVPVDHPQLYESPS